MSKDGALTQIVEIAGMAQRVVAMAVSEEETMQDAALDVVHAMLAAIQQIALADAMLRARASGEG